MVEVFSQNCFHVQEEAPRTKNSISMYLKIFLKLLCFCSYCTSFVKIYIIIINISRNTGIVIFCLSNNYTCKCKVFSVNSVIGSLLH